ncbi:MAG: metal-dependent transcriptional regulator [Candidatus Methanomethylophilaceae archaeon]|nr:metal-dependent transcriptional regulator [Candidatus Methanomethylophilaceae archaeon]
MRNDNREDYLINILRLTDGTGTVRTTELASYMQVTPASVTEMLKILSKEGLVNYQRYRGVSLTEEGVLKARELRRKHHIMERFLTDVLDIDHEQAHDQACAVEHSISEETADKMCRMIGTKIDADCTTCKNPCNDGTVTIVKCIAVSKMRQGDKGKISHLSSGESTMVRKLISMGFVPGRDIQLTTSVSDKGARIIKIGEATIAIDKDMASAIFVNLE